MVISIHGSAIQTLHLLSSGRRRSLLVVPASSQPASHCFSLYLSFSLCTLQSAFLVKLSIWITFWARVDPPPPPCLHADHPVVLVEPHLARYEELSGRGACFPGGHAEDLLKLLFFRSFSGGGGGGGVGCKQTINQSDFYLLRRLPFLKHFLCVFGVQDGTPHGCRVFSDTFVDGADDASE